MKLSEDLKRERQYVEEKLAGKVICSDCHAKLDTFANKCTADLADICPGFEWIEDVKAEYHRTKTAQPVR